jgi:hypothetical protein
MHNSLYKLSTKHFLERIDPKEVACKTLTNQLRRAVGTSAREGTRARTTTPVGKEAVDGAWGQKGMVRVQGPGGNKIVLEIGPGNGVVLGDCSDPAGSIFFSCAITVG